MSWQALKEALGLQARKLRRAHTPCRARVRETSNWFWALAAIVVLATARPASAAVTYLQGSDQDPSGAGSSVSVTYASAQSAGDLNVVVVSFWNSGAINSVTDSKGNTYTPVLTTTFMNMTLVTYYAQNIVAAGAGANTVTVTFNQAVYGRDVRVLEYSGIPTSSPVDVSGGSSGTGITTSSGSVTTTNANDLLVASTIVGQTFQAVGSGYTKRIVSSPDGDLTEDEVVSSAGAYTATSTQSASDIWAMQVVAFKAASGDTTPPTAPTNLTATAISGAQINLSWTASTDNVGVTGYFIERCQGASCSNFAEVGASTTNSYSDAGLTASTSY